MTNVIEIGTFAHFTSHLEPSWPLRELLVNYALFSDEEDIDAAVVFLRRCLMLQPESRASAKELAEDPWLVIA